MILVACAIETGFFWVAPLSFRALIDNALGPRDQQQLALVLSVLAAGDRRLRGRRSSGDGTDAHLQTQIASDLRFEIFRKVEDVPSCT